MTEGKKTFIILTPGFPENEADTTCLPFLQNFVETLNRTYPGIELIVVTFQYPYHKGSYLWKGNQIVSFAGREKGKLNRLMVWIQVWMKLVQLKRQKNIMGLFSLWCTECALIGKYFSRIFNLRHKIWIIGQEAKKGNGYVQLIHPKPSDLIAMSDFLRGEFYKNYGIKPLYVIPNLINTLQFPCISAERTLDILGAGSLTSLKQYDVFIEVINSLSKAKPEVKALIVGGGPQETALRTMIQDLDLKNNITLAGELPHIDVLKAMQKTRIFLHPSKYEGCSTVCLEALYAGAHAVSFTKPMDIPIQQWHYVNNKEEMARTVLALLQDTQITYQSVLPFPEGIIVRDIIGLYLRNE